MKILYTAKKFRPDSIKTIDRANRIISDYARAGDSLTLRQLYYQFVSRAWIANNQKEYDKLGSVINDARLAGLLDWDAIEDRTRNVRSLAAWEDPASILNSVSKQYRTDPWIEQDSYVEVWIEKDALIGVIERVCNEYQVPYFSCRGYVSQSEMHGAAMRIQHQALNGKRCTILHLGDHDPSGIDMTRDIRDRMHLFSLGIDMQDHDPLYSPEELQDHRSEFVNVERIALSMKQIRELNPPPNPAKLADARAADYIRKYGSSSWELDALEPAYIRNLLTQHITSEIDSDAWKESRDKMQEDKRRLVSLSENWDEISGQL